MHTHNTENTVPTPWILLTLSVLCCYMLWHPEPVPLAQFPTAAEKANISLSPSGGEDVSAYFRTQRHQDAAQRAELPQMDIPLSHTALLLICLTVIPLIVVQLMPPGWDAPPVPALWATFCHPSRSPPLA